MTKRSRQKFKYLENKKSFLRPEAGSLTILTIKRGLFKKLFTKDRYFKGHNGTSLKFSVTIDCKSPKLLSNSLLKNMSKYLFRT